MSTIEVQNGKRTGFPNETNSAFFIVKTYM
jgi:hypothetical protein